MNKLNNIAYYLTASINNECSKIALESFKDNDFILIEDAGMNITEVKQKLYPFKYINNDFYVLKRTKQEEFNKKYNEILQSIINRIIKGGN